MAKELPIRSLVPLQLLFYLNQWYSIFWLIIEILVFIFKGQTLPFASGVLAGEIVLFITLFFVDVFRIFFGTKANLTERVSGIIVSLVITAPTAIGFIFFIIWQHYVLRVELIINSIQLVFLGLEIIFQIVALIIFARK